VGQHREMIEATLLNLRFDMDCIGESDKMWEQLHSMTDDELIRVFNEFVEDME